MDSKIKILNLSKTTKTVTIECAETQINVKKNALAYIVKNGSLAKISAYDLEIGDLVIGIDQNPPEMPKKIIRYPLDKSSF